MSKENIFRLYWGDVDESFRMWYFYHENKTEEEFDSDVNSLLKKFGKDYIESEEVFVNLPDWIQFIIPKMYDIGYKPIEFIEKALFGCELMRKNDIGVDEDIDDLREIVGDELIIMAVNNNEKVYKL